MKGKTMTKRDMTKRIANFIVGSSVSYTVTNALHNNAPKDTPVHTAEVYVGAAVVGAVAANAVSPWTDEKVDQIFDCIERFKKAH